MEGKGRGRGRTGQDTEKAEGGPVKGVTVSGGNVVEEGADAYSPARMGEAGSGR